MKTIKKSTLMKKLGAFVSVHNTPSRCGYGEAPNQFEIRFENGSAFQSYRSLIAVKMGGQLYLTGNHDYSNTTCGHVGRWCGYNTKERRAGLDNEKFIFITED